MEPDCVRTLELATEYIRQIAVTGFGVLADVLLLGILTVQIYFYYIGFPGDRLAFKLAVTTVYVIGLSQTAVAIFDYFIVISHLFHKCEQVLSDLEATSFNDGKHSWFSINLSCAVVAFVVQFSYAYRIFLISQKPWVPILVVLLSLAQLVTGVLLSICTGASPDVMFKWDMCIPDAIYLMWAPLSAACDVTISIYMSIFLLKRRKSVIKKKLYAHITRIVQLVAETGAATSLVVLCYIATLNIPLNIAFGYSIPGLAASKVYSNSLLILLNSRAEILGARETVPTTTWNTLEIPTGVIEGENAEVISRNILTGSDNVQLRARVL
ncbi:hypothetical protein NP233_g5171 [Leucocoprinus birnbaumii]|uniref:DUF6534 domain-containing protein n=1 Tax=Leucocoprinus birnbaumii TaxID=56174 RepID=A0AAD5VTD7_9AGAR|nr:hypothetical protein NP233_g5171 [Leucocoprinus birnbaumii]